MKTSLRRWKLGPPCRSNASIARGADFREDVTATGAIGSGAVIPKNPQILLQQMLMSLVRTSVWRLSIGPLQVAEKPWKALLRPANKFRLSRNLAKASLKFPAKALDSCAIRNATLCRRHRTFLSLLKLYAASSCATGCGFTARPDAAAVARSWSSYSKSMAKNLRNIKGSVHLK